MAAAKAKDLVRKPVMATVRLTIPAGNAKPGPPVGAILGQLKLNLMAFCKDFNARTQKYKPEAPMAVSLIAYKDQTFDYVIKSPKVSWFLKQAAGVESASGRPGHVVASSVSLKHVYEIAAIKKEDPGCQHLSIESISRSIIGSAKSMGINVVKELD
ncbi:uncharacterized protein LOC110717900 [Chenopodium quinoa]|uniref:Large ribosomal subunit protein uL11m n=1 Tax=Chenopodium quinoa TaxID=63459 RepID=A0A803KSP7_CHEQI|nr:uncharacterized protein LOC110682156 [Chenopodium quinoa]XP_021752380.1 uncharacterized protein LOC110717900 [Chenopodium quinoa]